ncbi:reverse transcriptase domain, Reverse transcriptase zinc-binding domain protein [Artemisia annua]|uniref:Reverse transcriptase domain, Reverse transcriptase zinc-binding domain protein n=1 Tax=Artemisia annua TaxID=35608 RepID=A0A2U1KRE6_ARTAN|nr:reverse transcriptase domain, Reverse transcriptase zinc-binding domain protein [Artemisia annua]
MVALVKIGSGEETRFWSDIWSGNTTFCEKYACLFALERDQGCHVNQKLVGLVSCHSRVIWTWRRPIRSGREQSEFNDLQHEISSIILSSNQVSWRWSLNPSGEFSVSALRAIIDSKLLGQTGTKLRWNNLVPSKINILAWRIRNYRLATRANLDKRGIDLHSILCPFCEEKIEDEDHLFALCTFSRNIWDLIRKWWGLDVIPLDGALNVLDVADDGDLNLGERTSSFFDVVVLCAIGWIWRARNLLVFQAVKVNTMKMIDDIIATS